MSPPPRHFPDIPLPAYAFIPGQAPHPYADAGGHRYDPHLPEPRPPQHWRDAPHYLLGLDLINRGYPWEAHEIWERLWQACGRHGPDADFLKALIKLAAAAVKQREGVPAGVRSHALRAAVLWRDLAVTRETMFGLRLRDLIAGADAIATHGWPPQPVYLEPRDDE
jgi:hypothetical protein